ncbi:MAG: hypothetical protein U0103_23195 [Candidatus Obscuribacterales bacterium]
MNNLSILQKALILACAPLLFQVAFAGVLFNSLSELNQAIEKELSCQAVIASANSVYESSLDGAVRGATNVLTKSATIESILKDHIRTARENIARLRSLTSNDREQSKHAERLAELTSQIESAFLEENSNYEKGLKTNPLIVFHRYQLLQKLVEPLSMETRAMVDVEINKLSTTKTTEKRRAVHLILFAGLGIDLIICCALAYFFTVSMVERLSVLRKNALSFADGQAFYAAVPGTDELTSLDRSFRAMANNLSTAKNWRQEYLSMLNHEIRLPLTASIGAIALIERGAYGKLLGDAPKKLKARGRELAALVDLLEDLLEFERMSAGKLNCQIQDCRLDPIMQESAEKVGRTRYLDGQTIDCQGSDLTVKTDPEKLTRLLSRLLSIIARQCAPDTQLRLYSEMRGENPVVSIQYQGEPLKFETAVGVAEHSDRNLGWEYLSAVAILLNVKITCEQSGETVCVRVTLADGAVSG